MHNRAIKPNSDQSTFLGIRLWRIPIPNGVGSSQIGTCNCMGFRCLGRACKSCLFVHKPLSRCCSCKSAWQIPLVRSIEASACMYCHVVFDVSLERTCMHVHKYTVRMLCGRGLQNGVGLIICLKKAYQFRPNTVGLYNCMIGCLRELAKSTRRPHNESQEQWYD